ncbi:MAG: hypothetical protein PSV35_06810, partial [bacterium]|nr:hypothetical protein [bacterium]
MQIITREIKGKTINLEQLNRAVAQLVYLDRCSLPHTVHAPLLYCSFKHNITQASLFPLRKLMEINSLNNIKSDQSQALFNAITLLISKITPELESRLLKALIDKTTSFIQEKANSAPELAPLLILLIKSCRSGRAQELTRYVNVLKKLEQLDDTNLILWVNIMTGVGHSLPQSQLGILFKIPACLEANQAFLKDIARLYDYPPYPQIDELLLHLQKNYSDLKTYLDEFDKDPMRGRSPKSAKLSRSEILKRQFDTTQVSRTITSNKELLETSPISNKQYYELAQQVIYINAIGKDYPLIIGDKSYSNLTVLSRSSLKSLSDQLIAQIRVPLIGKVQRIQYQLRLLAVMREQYFRLTGMFISADQMVAIVLSLTSSNHNMLLPVSKKERQSSTSLFLAALQWINADGGTVDVVVEPHEISQDYQIAADFFKYLGISSARIKEDSLPGTYLVGGINYATVADLAIYRYRARANNELLTGKNNNQPLSSNLIINTADFSRLEERTVFNFSTNNEELGEDGSNNWIYRVINQFVKQPSFKNVARDVLIEEHDIKNLRLFLDKHAKNGLAKALIKDYSPQKLSDYLNSAFIAQQLKEGEDFHLVQNVQGTWIATPQKTSTSMIFAAGIQQLLHARLQEEYPEKFFAIKPEISFNNSVSAKTCFDVYKQQGRLIAVSGELNNKSSLKSQCEQFSIDKSFGSSFCNKPVAKFKLSEQDKHQQTILKALTHVHSAQPVVLIARDEIEVRQLQQQLKQHYKKLKQQVFIGQLTAEQNAEQRANWLTKYAGHMNSITIATPSSLQNAHFQTLHSSGFLTIQTYIDSARSTEKLLAKIGNSNQMGSYNAVYEDQGSFFIRSWTYQTEQEKQSLLKGVA